jgi:hypothetical protein
MPGEPQELDWRPARNYQFEYRTDLWNKEVDGALLRAAISRSAMVAWFNGQHRVQAEVTVMLTAITLEVWPDQWPPRSRMSVNNRLRDLHLRCRNFASYIPVQLRGKPMRT